MLYLVRFDNALKIGYTSNLINRLKSFQTTQLNVELISSREGDLKHEKILHELCSSSKLKNELFKDDPIVIQIFNNHIFNDQEVMIKNLEIENKELIKDNQFLRNEINQLEKQNEKLKENLLVIGGKIILIEQRINENKKGIEYTPESTMLINEETLVKTNDCFNYEKKYPHKGDNSVMIKYSNNIIDIANGKLYYDIKNKLILNKYFYPAKSYPEGNKTIKYYYYDSDCNIKYEDIMNIKTLVINTFINS